MSKIEVKVYEPPMCCSTGVCGPDVDDELIQFNDALKQLEQEGVEVERNSMNHNPFAFQQNQTILDSVNNKGTDDLPITTVNDKVIEMGEYPALEKLKAEINQLKEEE
ncbi:arsenite efflux transporter metallochaperone ArsD [Selenihalanaerobacter shriftii]|uniref:Arsenical resistance operon trans-acting repressor ArsD n=1 Tax=Selenihalanaerobacter shriftii TaxID=142842 RepID=A0A1T4PGN3_9FIRM|nr:arsenite efflux transporter metallochaperone ArsD [Selenihalanaerobacter shriftii]SJZ89938.1 Arsenical resistance operon trans-acting repressor ArsD [Selenihalanaerobacter shriftii]